MQNKNEYFTKSNWINCLKRQLQDLNINLIQIEIYISLYEYAKGGALFFPTSIFTKVGGSFNNYAPVYLKKVINSMQTSDLINKSRKQDPSVNHNYSVRFIEFNVHPKKQVDWNR